MSDNNLTKAMSAVYAGVADAVEALVDVANDGDVQPAARVTAATMICRMAGLLDKQDKGTDPETLSESATIDELKDELNKLETQRKAQRKGAAKAK